MLYRAQLRLTVVVWFDSRADSNLPWGDGITEFAARLADGPVFKTRVIKVTGTPARIFLATPESDRWQPEWENLLNAPQSGSIELRTDGYEWENFYARRSFGYLHFTPLAPFEEEVAFKFKVPISDGAIEDMIFRPHLVTGKFLMDREGFLVGY